MTARQHNWLLFAACLCTGATALWLVLGVLPLAILTGAAATVLVAFGFLHSLDSVLKEL